MIYYLCHDIVNPVLNPLLHVFPIGNNTIHIFLSARISDQEIKVYLGISKKLNPKNGRVKVIMSNGEMGIGIVREDRKPSRQILILGEDIKKLVVYQDRLKL